MTYRTRTAIALLLFLEGLLGCGRSGSPTTPSVPSPAAPAVPQPASNQLVVFKDPVTGLSTSDVRDAQDHVVQFSTANELIWFDGTRLPGHRVSGPGQQIPGGAAEASCECWLVVRFGASDGERRAYLTADYIHFNPGTLVALEITGGALVVTATDVFPPGRYTLSGIVTEATATGPVPIENAAVWRLDEEQTGWDQTTTDRNGFYQLHGLSDGSRPAGVNKDGYQRVDLKDIPVHGDTRFDVQLVRR